MPSSTSAEDILAALPHLYRGPGGSAAIIKDGEILAKRSWGYANLGRRAPMTPETILPICSISKQMVCLAMTSLVRDPSPAMLMKSESPAQLLQAELDRMLPNLPPGKLRIDHLHKMQSGVRDYWALTTLWGARPDDPFSIAVDAPQALARIKSFHFEPGTEFSYSNVNFHVLGRILENVSGQSLGQLLSERVFIPAGMSSASLYINTQGISLPVIGYEGNEQTGFFTAVNRIEWAGDAGISASLNDMIAYEKYLDRSSNDPSSLYYLNSQAPKYEDGSPASYGFGLARTDFAGRTTIRHGGALRGFKLNRVHVPSERLSVVTMFNHHAAAPAAAEYVLGKLFDHEEPEPPQDLAPASEWTGDFLDEERWRYVGITPSRKPGRLVIRYHGLDEVAKLAAADRIETPSVSATIQGDQLTMHRKDDNRLVKARRIAKPTDEQIYHVKSPEYTGAYRCEEIDSTFYCSGADGTLYGSFNGYIGKGPIWLMRYIGEDVWVLGNPRAMDLGAPGDWTIVFHRDGQGKVEKLTIGCFLAWTIEYKLVKS